MPAPQNISGAQPTILLVDDYVDALDVWEIYLRGEGFQILTATTGPEALARATAAVPDLIVMDLQLPGLSGPDVARALRSQAATRHIPLIAATGHAHGAPLDDARQSGFDAVIVKPCDPVAMVAEIRRLLARPRASGPAPAGH